jgi:hypothetical protein
MALVPKDRLAALLSPGQTTLNGIDFVEIASDDETVLRVHFLKAVPSLQGQISAPAITGGETIPSVPVLPINNAGDWGTDAEGRPLLTLRVAAPGDFSTYILRLTSSLLDPYFDHVAFSFKARCPSTLDCEPPPPACPPPPGQAPPIDYLAKDFLSFRQALLDFSALRYPEWQERSEADFGVMFLEALCGLADDLSYTQDRVAAEGALDTAMQRRSLVRLARLVDYESRPATAARVLLQLDVAGGPVPSGLVVSAQGPDGVAIDFETGNGLVNAATGDVDLTNFPASPAWNRLGAGRQPNIVPYYWDESQKCLRAGSTEAWVAGWGFGFVAGQDLLIDTEAAVTADPHVREVVQLLAAQEVLDPLYNRQLTRIVWRPEDALQADHDLTQTVLAGNLVPATQGRRFTETFAIDQAPPNRPDIALAVVRTGPNNTDQYLYTLRNAPLVWLAPPSGGAMPAPEITLHQKDPGVPGSSTLSRWRRSLLEADSVQDAFTLDPASYRATAFPAFDGAVIQDYDGDAGTTLRFGDDVFGPIPKRGTLFSVTYRVGGGAAGNVAADTITRVSDGAPGGMIRAVTNPFPAAGGADEEPAERVRRQAPQAFRAVQYRAVRPRDYEQAAQTLPWVQRAGTAFRWTGSWLTVFTTVDPKGTTVLPTARRVEVIDMLNRYRLAGYESYVPPPRYVGLDLMVYVCAKSDAFRGDVEAAVLAALGTSVLPDGTRAFFHPDNFTFGTPLEPSALEAAVQGVHGVAGVIRVEYRRRDRTPEFVELTDPVTVAVNEILRVENDRSRPDAGSVRVYPEGGK